MLAIELGGNSLQQVNVIVSANCVYMALLIIIMIPDSTLDLENNGATEYTITKNPLEEHVADINSSDIQYKKICSKRDIAQSFEQREEHIMFKLRYKNPNTKQ